MSDLRALLAPIKDRDDVAEPCCSAPLCQAEYDRRALLAAIEAVIGEIADTDLETNEAVQGDLADRILGVIAVALGSDTTHQEGTQ